MSQIDREQVEKVAKLARLDLSDQELTEFTGQLSSILEYIEKLNELDTDNVEPLAHCLPVHNIFREDVIIPSLDVDAAMKNAPASFENQFKVPKVLDGGPGA